MSKITEVGIIETSKELEKILSEVNPHAWLAANLKTKGKTLIQIKDQFSGLYSLEDISYMLKKVVAINHGLAIKNPDMLRQLFIDELDSIKEELYATNNGIMTEKMANVLLRMIEQKSKLLGLNAPEVHQVDVVQTIRTANESLAEKRANFLKSRNVIDVPPAPIAQPPVSTAKQKLLEKLNK